ncbi:protein kinase domain-containing protein [Methanoregula sp.]|jgi:CBS domain-containing protein|uniref:protein kinase domain-containing protein n=1 Tax=Methanoregula sp. TaxID=2052170 RepID=UPI003C13769E
MGLFDFLSKKPSSNNNRSLKVKDLMTQNPIVISENATIAHVEEIFSNNRFWSIYVGHPDHYVGIITRDDLKFRVKTQSKSSPASSIMSKGVFSIDENADVEDANNFLCNKKINGLAVTRNGKHCGTITRYDIKNKQPKSPEFMQKETKRIDSQIPPSPPPIDAGLLWTDEDVQLLRQFWDDGKPIQNIADLLKRSPDAVVHKLIDTGLIGYNDDNCNPRPARFGLVWDDREKRQLLSEFNSGISIPIIASVHQRNLNGILRRLVKMHIIDFNDRGILEKYSQNRAPPQYITPKQLPPDLSDRYTESEIIGKGGFAWVFKAKRKDGKFVAVKIPISLDESTGKSFIAELQNWTRLSHPNIVKVSNFNIMPSPYFEMELCDSSLADRKKPIENEEAAWLLFNICEGLKFTHSNKIIHRDLKPQNILLKDGVPKISDWGLSREISESTSTTASLFTPLYAAPEQLGNKPKDERTDIWQLGVIFYELVTGLLPFTGDSMVEVMAGIATKNPILPSAINPSSDDVESIIMKCLEKNPDKRYQSVIELQKDLGLYLRITYTKSLKMSETANDLGRTAYYCGDLFMVSLVTGDLESAYKYLVNLVQYARGDVKDEVQDLAKEIKMRMDMGVELPGELIQKSQIVAHKMGLIFSKCSSNVTIQDNVAIRTDILNPDHDNTMDKKIKQTENKNVTPTPRRGDYAGICPKCGSRLVWRVAQKTGELYRGCDNFDGGCRYQERSY